MKKTLLITGASGFIGFHTALSCVQRGIAVVGMDNFNDYYSVGLKRERAKLLYEKGIVVEEADILDRSALDQLIETYQVTHIVHLAAQAGVRYSLQNPQAYIDTNVQGFLNVLECCRAHPHLKLVYASSSSVYGLNTKVPFSESDRTDHQASLYGVTKKSNELMASTYHHLFKIPVIGLRFFTVYGPWGRPDMAYYMFTKAILEGKAIDVYNDGHMERDFTYIDDIVEGILAAVELEAACEIFNLGNNKPMKLLDFIDIIERKLGKKAIKNYLPIQSGDVLTTYADITHSHQKLGFSPKISPEEGLSAFVDWYCSYREGVA